MTRVKPATTDATITADVVVLGAGAAGLFATLTAAEQGAGTVLISQAPLATTASYWAQGGIAAALGADDSPGRHLEDTLRAGRGTSRASAARVLAEEAPGAVAALERLGTRFDHDQSGGLALGLEGGHSARRVVHAGGSATGRRIARQLSAQAAAHPRVTVIEGASARAVIVQEGRCLGARVRSGDRMITVSGRAVILATGGAAALWARSTNPPAAVGSGLMIAHRAGAALADLEFVQFHPTALNNPSRNQGFLISEAMRGEGALLLNDRGERFVDELAPRDVVSLAIENEMRDPSGATTRDVSLDLRMIDPLRFPNVFAKLAEAGFDPTTELIPVAPAAHYSMGGVATDLDGRSTVAGLYAIGECSCTGLHGANRLASNSLAECLVFGRRAALAAIDEPAVAQATLAVATDSPRESGAGDQPDAGAGGGDTASNLRDNLWRWAGIERDGEGLRRLAGSADELARLIANSALARRETRGAHRRRDFPRTDPTLDHRHTVLRPGAAPELERWD